MQKEIRRPKKMARHTQKALLKSSSFEKYLSHATVPITDDPILTFCDF
jgi:hypothetical protein